MRILSIFLSLLIICCTRTGNHSNDYDLSGKVIRIADGDTFTLLTENKEQVKVRMHGIDSPEKGQDYGQVARQHLSDLIFNKSVFIKQMDKDRYGRIVALVFNEKKQSINEAMLQAGLAWHYKEYDDDPDWDRLEESARKTKTGLWAHAHPIPPWQWRKEKRAPAN